MADSTGSGASQNNTGSGASQNNNAHSRPPQGQSVVAYMMENKVETTLWLTRLFTIVCTILFIIPLFGDNPYAFYQRALIAAAATSALRLHQRVPNVQLNMEFLRMLFTEDSSHYLIYCILFLYSYPITLCLVPIFLFALLHACSFTKTILNILGPNSVVLVRSLVTKLETNQVQILRFIASAEIFLMPAIIVFIFSGKCSVFMPFVYYRFLSLRYASRRNPYCRVLFYEFRLAVEHLCGRPQCPQLIRNICFKSIAFISRLAPPVTPS